MTSLPQPPAPIPEQPCSGVLWASPAPKDLFGQDERTRQRWTEWGPESSQSQTPQNKLSVPADSPLPQGIQSPLTGTLVTGWRRSGGPPGKWKDGLTSRGERVDAGGSAPGLGSRRHLAPPTPSLAPPTSSSSRPLSLLPRSPPPDSHGAAKFRRSGPRTGRGLGASCVPVAPSSRTDPVPGPPRPCCAAAGEEAVALPRSHGWPPGSQLPSLSRPRPRHRTAAPRGLGCGH